VLTFADRLNWQWVGIDQSAMAVKVTGLRLQKQADLFSFEQQPLEPGMYGSGDKIKVEERIV
jgi:hypothetical protein